MYLLKNYYALDTKKTKILALDKLFFFNFLGLTPVLNKNSCWEGGPSPVAQWERVHLPTQEMWARSLGSEDPLEKEMAMHSGILAWKTS